MNKEAAPVYRCGGLVSKSTSETIEKTDSGKMSFDDFLIDCAKRE